MTTFLEQAETLVLSREFRQLEVKLEPFNIFRALDIESRETVHSAALRYLMDPSESHGLGDGFLRPLLCEMLRKTRRNPADVSGVQLDFGDVRVQCEKGVITQGGESGSIDIFVEHADWVAVIENKVDAAESKRQLRVYREFAEQEYAEQHRLLFFLTPDERESAYDHSFRPVGYATLLEVLATTLALHRANLSEPVVTFIEHYIETTRRNIVGDSEIAEICRQLWNTHRPVLQKLMEYRESYRARAIALIAECATTKERFRRVYPHYTSEVDLFPRSWSEYADTLGYQDETTLPLVYLSLFVSQDGSTLNLRIRFNSTPADGDDTLKRNLIRLFDEERASEDVSGSWTAASVRLKFTNDGAENFRAFVDEDGVGKVLDKALREALDELAPYILAIAEALKSASSAPD